MVSKSILYNWLATNKIKLILDELLAREPTPDMVIHTSSRYHAYLEAKLEETEDSNALRVELNKIRVTLKHIIHLLAETPSSTPIQNYPMTGIEILNDLLIGIGGNAAYDGTKIVRAHLSNATISPAEREIFEKTEALLDLSVRNVNTQTDILSELAKLRQAMQPQTKENTEKITINNYSSVEKQIINPIINGAFNM